MKLNKYWKEVFAIFLLLLVIVPTWGRASINLNLQPFLAEALAVALGVFGGLWANKRLEEDRETKELLGALESVDAELQSNIKAIDSIREGIISRPTLVNREKYSLNRILRMVKDEEKFVISLCNLLKDRIYFITLPTISKIQDRKLFELLVNTYKDIHNVKFGLQLDTMSHITGQYTEDQKTEFVDMLDKHFEQELKSLDELNKRVSSTDRAIRKKIKEKLSRYSP